MQTFHDPLGEAIDVGRPASVLERERPPGRGRAIGMRAVRRRARGPHQLRAGLDRQVQQHPEGLDVVGDHRGLISHRGIGD